MQGIPPVKDTDAEDVAWGLQTAEALWKRGERGDAIVWLRRAAQAAGDVADDDRALELARFAAELTDWVNENAPGTLSIAGATQPPSGAAPAPSQAPAPVITSSAAPAPAPAITPSAAPAPASFPPVDVFPPPVPADIFPPPVPAAILQGTSNAPPPPKVSKPPPVPKAVSKPPVPSRPSLSPAEEARSKPPLPSSPSLPPSEESRPLPPPAPPASQPTMQTAEPSFSNEPAPPPSEPEPHSASVPPADRVHAGMFNPWEEGSGAPSSKQPSAAPAPVAVARFSEEEDEVITSANLATLRQSARPAATSARPEPPRAHSPSEPPMRAAPAAPVAPSPPAPKVAPKPPPLPPRARAASISPEAAPSPPRPSEPEVPPAPPEPPPRVTPPPPSPTQVTAPDERATRVDGAEAEATEAVGTQAEPPAAEAAPPLEETPLVAIPVRPSEAPRDDAPAAEPPAPPATNTEPPAAAPALDLEGVDAFADLPDDARAAFAAAATVSNLAEAEEVSHFALAYILEGALDVSATMVDAPASRLAKGAVLRSRGTTDEGVPMRLVCAGGDAVVATWSDDAVEDAFRTCPWVEDDLRAAADKMLILVGITIGPLGERLDASLREQIVGRLQMRTLAAGEVVVNKGEPVPLLIVGVGEIELVDGDAVKGNVGSGEFLFAGEVLGAGAAPLTARAGSGGALVLQGERHVAQELLVTCPPLLEVFAGM